MSKALKMPELSKGAVTLLIDTFLERLIIACKRWGVLPGEVYGNLHVKRKAVARAREDVILWMREHVGMNSQAHPTDVAVYDDPLELRANAYPVSYPILGRCLGLNHSTCILAVQRAKKRRRAEGLTTEAESAKISVHGEPVAASEEQRLGVVGGRARYDDGKPIPGEQ